MIFQCKLPHWQDGKTWGSEAASPGQAAEDFADRVIGRKPVPHNVIVMVMSIHGWKTFDVEIRRRYEFVARDITSLEQSQ